NCNLQPDEAENLKSRRNVTPTIMKKCTLIGILTFTALAMHSCNEDIDYNLNISNEEPTTRAIDLTPYFDWENVNYAPTPPSQQPISMPWLDSGSLANFYSTEVMRDYMKIDGWELLYNKFVDDASYSLRNPYFILYNKYRGVIRLYLYLTDTFSAESSYINSVIFLNSNTRESTILNFLGKSYVDASDRVKEFENILPVVVSSIPPLRSNGWYMAEYEIAYDPSLAQLNSSQLPLNWHLYYSNVQTIELGGKATGLLKATVGSTGASIGQTLANHGKASAVGTAAFKGLQVLNDATISSDSTNNSLGLRNHTFTWLKSSVTDLANGNFISSSLKLISGLVGFTSKSQTPLIDYTVDVDIELTGTLKGYGSLPGNPITFNIPGTIITDGDMPYYNRPLGVINFTSKPSINIDYYEHTYWELDPQYGSEYLWVVDQEYKFPTQFDYSSYLLINPEVHNVAKVTIKAQELIQEYYGLYGSSIPDHNVIINPNRFRWTYYQQGQGPVPDFELGVRFIIDIEPYDGSPKTTIIKTFDLERKITKYITADPRP
ncbi:MAG: hypothetical protein LUE26_00700, partial [Alistipes sp.]|nr:hypothetical protein [Alistipes sp.]